MTIKFDGLENALNNFVDRYRRRFDELFWEWRDLGECQADLVLRPKMPSDGSCWRVPVVGDDNGGFDGILNIDGGREEDWKLSIDSLFEYLWRMARVGSVGEAKS